MIPKTDLVVVLVFSRDGVGERVSVLRSRGSRSIVSPDPNEDT